MNISIHLVYVSRGIKAYRSGSFPAKGRSQVKIAIDWIQDIKKEMDVDEIIEVIANSNQEITEEIKSLLITSLN